MNAAKLDAVVVAAREYVGPAPLDLARRARRGDKLIGIAADSKWRRLVLALLDLEDDD